MVHERCLFLVSKRPMRLLLLLLLLLLKGMLMMTGQLKSSRVEDKIDT